MNLTSYFIKHPVSAIILNALIVIVGVLCFYSLIIREYPEVIIPKIIVEAHYPNASAELVESSVTNILEDELAGVEGLDIMSSETSFGSSRIILNFNQAVSMDRALIATRAAVGVAKSKFPVEVKDPAIKNGDSDNSLPFMAACLESSSLESAELTHYVNTSLKNGFRSLKGVASVQIWGSSYMYNVILDHQKLYNFGINADEILEAIRKSANASIPAGKFQKEIPTTIISEIKSEEDLGNILIKDQPHPVFLKSLAEIKLSSDTDSLRMKINGKPGLCIGVNKASDANPFDTSALVHKYVDSISQTLPSTLKIQILLDQANFIRSSIDNIKSSILEAMFFVLIIVFLFLRNVRATLIPVITIPISLVGSLLFLKIFGFSINIMTLLAMVLAIGLVVDDAIVVLENITRHIEEGRSVFDATINGAKEIGFAIVAMTLTLTSVYAPIAFIGGLTGQLFIEFSAALAGSVIISGITALTLSPLMCATFFKQKNESLFPQIDHFLENLTDSYFKFLDKIITHHSKIILGISLFALIAMIIMFKLLPSELTPKEDRGIMGVWITPGKNQDETEKHADKVSNVIKDIPESLGSMVFVFDAGGYAIPLLKPIEERARSTNQIVESLRPVMTSFPSFDAYLWSVDTGLPGLEGSSENAELTLMISTIDSYKELYNKVEALRDKAMEKKLFSSVYHNLNLDNLGYSINIDKDIMAKVKLNEFQVGATVETFFSGNKSLTFKKDGIIYSILIEGDKRPWGIEELYLTNSDGNRISIASFATLTAKQEPKSFFHYNQMRSVAVKASLTENDNLQDSMNKLYNFADNNLPTSYQKTWTGIAKTYKDSAAILPILFMLALIFIYSILAVQFDNFVDPLIILFTVPLACSGALFTMYLAHASLNIYSQIGLITLIGLITKHGILIVEFANKLLEQKMDSKLAILTSAKLRLRPILMTTGAMVAGCIPLIISKTAGFEARNAIGLVLVSGVTIGTIFTLFILPSLYYMIKLKTLKENIE
ncbi:MAG: efflux RND transporter permease subunit [Rickettsiales bacterium]